MDFQDYKKEVDDIVNNYIEQLSFEPCINEGIKYILSEGKRLRPIITLSIIDTLNFDNKSFRDICLISEFAHCASLIIDDLPAFDNALYRRGKDCLHVIKNEKEAYITSLTLISEATLFCNKQLKELKEKYSQEEAYERFETLVENLLTNMSTKKVITGQLLSTGKRKTKLPLKDMREILFKKTSSFFEIAIMSSWICCGGDLSKINEISELSKLLGLCYQIYDDFIDYKEDINNPSQFSHNYVYNRSVKVAYDDFIVYIEKLKKLIEKNGLNNKVFSYIINLMTDKINTCKENIKEEKIE